MTQIIHIRLVLLLSILMRLALNCLSAQDFTAEIDHISVEEGLPGRFVNSVYQDSDGFIWVSTKHGLARYDGYAFVTFSMNVSGLTSDSVFEVFEDDSKRLWVKYSSSNIIDVIDLRSLKVMRLDELIDLPFEVDLVHDIRSDEDLGIIISLVGGKIYKYKGGFELIYNAQHGSTDIIHADSKHLFLYLENKEVHRISISGELLNQYHFEDKVYGMGLDDQDNVWLFEYTETDYLHRISPSGKLEKVDLVKAGATGYIRSSATYHNFKISPQGYLVFWFKFGVLGHMFVSDPENGVMIDLQAELKPFSTYGTARVMDIFFDSSGRIWLGTDDGLFTIDIKENHFKTLLSENGGRSTRGMVKDDLGNLYVNALDGSVIIDTEGNEVGSKTRSYGLGATKGREGNLWFSNHNGWVERYTPDSKEIKVYKRKPGIRKFWSPWSIFQDNAGNIWTGASNGLFFIEKGSNEIERITDYQVWPEVGKNYIYHLTQTDDGIWLSSKAGLYLMNKDRKIVEAYTLAQEAPFKIPHEQVLYHHIDDEGVFWLGTNGGGLIRLNRELGEYQQFTMADGLSNDVIYAIYEDEFNQLWLPSNNGLMQFDRKSFRVKTYGVGDGIAHNEFNTSAHYRDDDGLLYFGGLKGITMFDPRDFSDANSNSEVPLRITNAQVLNGVRGDLIDKTSEVINEKEIVLEPSDKSLVLSFSLLNYEKTWQNTYAYRIEGLDSDWNYIQDNSLRLNALDYGDYLLKIKGRDAEGQWSQDELSIRLTILAPVYKQNWFIITSVFFIFIVFIIFFRWRVARLKRDQLHLQKMVAERTQTISEQMGQIENQAKKLRVLDQTKSRFFANISHELRTPLTLILGYLGRTLDQKTVELPDKMVADLTLSKNNGRKLLSLTEEILDLSKLEAGELKPSLKPIRFYAFLSRLIDSYESFLVEKHVTLLFCYELDKALILNIDESKFDKIINNLLSNASKYTDEGDEVELRVIALNKPNENDSSYSYELTVSDTGRGIHPEDLPHVFDRFYQSKMPDAPTEGGTGIGLALASELAKLMSGGLSVESSYGEGSSFRFSFSSEPVDEFAMAQDGKDALPTDSKLPKAVTVQPTTPSDPQASAKRILLVEDNAEMRDFVREILVEDFFVLEAKDGVEALKLLKTEQVDLIVSDLMMPRLDGYGLLQKLRGMEAHQDLPMMMLTARSADEDKMKAFDIGIDDYLTKPFLPEELTVRLKNLVKNRDARKQESEQKLEPGDDSKLTAFDRDFVKRAEGVVTSEIENPHFGIIDMAEALNISQRNLTRKVKRTTGLSPLQFIRELRLQKARQLLEQQEKETVSEVMRAVGVQSTGYFAKLYFERFGKRPSDYRIQHEV